MSCPYRYRDREVAHTKGQDISCLYIVFRCGFAGNEETDGRDFCIFHFLLHYI